MSNRTIPEPSGVPPLNNTGQPFSNDMLFLGVTMYEVACAISSIKFNVYVCYFSKRSIYICRSICGLNADLTIRKLSA